MENLSAKTVKIGALVAAVAGSALLLAACGKANNSANTQSAAPSDQTSQTTPTTDTANANPAMPAAPAQTQPAVQSAAPTVAPITNITSEGNNLNTLDQQGTTANQSLNDQPGNVQ